MFESEEDMKGADHGCEFCKSGWCEKEDGKSCPNYLDTDDGGVCELAL